MGVAVNRKIGRITKLLLIVFRENMKIIVRRRFFVRKTIYHLQKLTKRSRY